MVFETCSEGFALECDAVFMSYAILEAKALLLVA